MPEDDALKAARAALAALQPGRKIEQLALLGRGHINETLLVTFARNEPRRAVLQRLNRRVFPEPVKVMANLAILAAHLDRRRQRDPAAWPVDWTVVRPLGEYDGRDYFIDETGHCWRLLSYVDGAVELAKIATPVQAREAGRLLGLFHRLAADLDPGILYDTLPGFHVTPVYLAAYDRLGKGRRETAEEVYCREVIEAHRTLATILEEAAGRDLLRLRVIHGDPRLANMLFDRVSGRGAALIDLDTVKPGLLHYDLGDCLRSCCNPAGDDPAEPETVRFDTAICRDLLSGYLAEAGQTLTMVDYDLIYPALRLLAFELGLRFFSDHLAGDRYFKCARAGHNLQRALVQFRLLAEIEAQEQQILGLIEELRRINQV
jgi:Ser/Thr protein kinase RdoA (MazF antagonist)